jgi:hypothetical protein
MSESRWVGWLYQRGHWRKVCAAADIGTCSRLLGEEGQLLGVRSVRQAMTGGAPPRFTPGKGPSLPSGAADDGEEARGSAGGENAAGGAM